MNKLIKLCCTAVLLGLTSGIVLAADPIPAESPPIQLDLATTPADPASIRKALETAMPGFKVDSVEPSAIKGLYEVMAGSSVFYVSDNGQYLIEGHMIDIKQRKDVTEPKIAKNRVVELDKLGESKMIVFSPEKTQHTVSVFTDIDCGYCRKLHAEMDQYMAEGIKVRYLFFPRAGKPSGSYDKAVSVWCADDRLKAMTQAKSENKITPKTCDHPIDEHMALAENFGTRGTPLIVTESGTKIGGYVDAKRLKKMLESE